MSREISEHQGDSEAGASKAVSRTIKQDAGDPWGSCLHPAAPGAQPTLPSKLAPSKGPEDETGCLHRASWQTSAMR